MPVTRNECMGAICPPNSFDLQGGLLIPRCPARRPLPLMRFHLQDDPSSSSDDELPNLPDPWSVLEGPEGPDASRLPSDDGGSGGGPSGVGALCAGLGVSGRRRLMLVDAESEKLQGGAACHTTQLSGFNRRLPLLPHLTHRLLQTLPSHAPDEQLFADWQMDYCLRVAVAQGHLDACRCLVAAGASGAQVGVCWERGAGCLLSSMCMVIHSR